MNYKGIMMRSSILTLMVIVLAACASQQAKSPAKNIVWPQPPATARIAYLTEFSLPDDLGIKRGFFQWLSDVFTGKQEIGLVRPMSIVVTSDEKIFVADPGMNGVHRYDIREKDYHLIRQEDGKFLNSPIALALANDNSVFVVDSELARVFRIKAGTDHAEAVFPELSFKQPTGIAYDEKLNRLYITDTAAHKIIFYDLNSKTRGEFGRRGNDTGEFNFPTYLWADHQQRLYVTDSLNFRVQIFDSNGKFIRMFGQAGDGSGNLSRPKGITVDKNGHIYVMDAMFHALQIFSQEGELLLPIGQQGNQAGEFWLPVGVFIDQNNKIYIADSHNQRVQILRYLGGNT